MILDVYSQKVFFVELKLVIIFVTMNNDIRKINRKIENGIKLEETLIDILFGFFIFVIIFGIGFTFGIYSK